MHPGPYIYDKFGNLVFDGYGVLGSANAHNFHVCSYNGSDHLCFNQMNQQLGYGVGQGLIVDDNYRVVKQINIGSSAGNVDMHEFQLVNGGESALLSSYQAIPYDLSAFNITSGLGWLLQGVFQEVNVTTGEVVFEWFSSNHVDPSETDITPNTTDVSGTGFMPSTAFDYFHINAIDKSTQSGNYLVSARHISTVYYINATDGNIVWRLSHFGQSDFDVKGFNFSFQHDARLVSENSTTTVISIFDNASNGYNNSNTQSSGMLISIDHPSKTATLVEQWHMPRKGGVLSSSQGNTQLLPDGGAFIGWGNWAYATEFNASGDAVWHVQFASSSTMNYRAFSFNWTSTPSTTVPDVYSYASNNNNASNHVYVSWNGATTVSRWNFYGAQSPTTDSVTLVGSADKAGFETQWTSSKYYSWWMVEAVAADGTALRNSSFRRTFIPGQALLASACDDMGCQAASSYGEKALLSGNPVVRSSSLTAQ